jgi:hypothetical protein
MSIRLTDAQRIALNSTAAHEDRCLEIPASMKTIAVQKLAAKLLAAGLAKEIKAKGDAAIWRRDEVTGRGYALKITAAGMKEIAIQDEAAAKAEGKTIVLTRDESGPMTPTTPGVTEAPVSALVGFTGPRTGSKLATVVTHSPRIGDFGVELALGRMSKSLISFHAVIDCNSRLTSKSRERDKPVRSDAPSFPA